MRTETLLNRGGSMTLSQVLAGVAVTKIFQTMYGKMVVTHDVEINSIQYDSRNVGRGDVFVALKGTTTDGHAFIADAVTKGAKVVVLEDDTALPDAFFMHAGVVKVVVPDTRKALALMAANASGHPDNELMLVGVTGTNGKTSTTHLIRSILETHGLKTGLIGTIEYRIGEQRVSATHTTPESLELYSFLRQMVDAGCTAAVMEVSSHSLALHRVYGLKFAAGTFTNLTQDHLDFHQTMEKYFEAKQILFNQLDANAIAITNADDPHGHAMVAGSPARRLTYSIAGTADVVAHNISLSIEGTAFDITYRNQTRTVHSSLIGRFNVQNMLAAYATSLGLGIEHDTIVEGIRRMKSVPGRFQQFTSPAGWTAVVDYAHTHDALENCLRAIHDIAPAEARGRIITVFGAGGNRDKTKRPKMGHVAAQYSDVLVLTSDNPRHESPSAIISDIRSGIPQGTTVHVEPDRRAAIAMALRMAQRGDVILIAGKGHEDYQVVGDTKLHLDDREEVEQFMRTAQ